MRWHHFKSLWIVFLSLQNKSPNEHTTYISHTLNYLLKPTKTAIDNKKYEYYNERSWGEI